MWKTGLNDDKEKMDFLLNSISFLIAANLAQNCVDLGLHYKSFTIVIYNHNDSGQYYKTIMMKDLLTR